MSPANFALEHIFFPELSVRANEEYVREAEEGRALPSTRLRLYKVGDNKYQVALGLRVSTSSEADPYDIQALAIAVFMANPMLEEEDQQALIAHNGPNILYGALREQLASITSRGPWNEYYLPIVYIGDEDFLPEDQTDLMDFD